MLLLRWYANDVLDEHGRLVKGATAERAAGEALDQLVDEGWVVVHDAPDPRGGNLDHVVSGPCGVFLIETKFGGWARPEHIAKIKRQARDLSRELGGWITPVICLYGRTGGVRFTRGVYLASVTDLVPWLHEQRNRLPDSDLLQRWRDSF
jgi:hypothetical protein